MKKIALLLSVVVIGVGGFFAYKHFTTPNPMNQLGEEQVFANTDSNQKTFTVKKEGYYDIKTTKGNEMNLISRVPLVNEEMLGQFFDKDEEITLLSGEEVQFQPAKFEKLSDDGKKITLNKVGNYLIGKQFPSGQYKITLKNELGKMNSKEGKQIDGRIQCVIYNPNDVRDSESFELNNEKKSMTFDLKNNKLFAVKSSGLKFEMVLDKE